MDEGGVHGRNGYDEPSLLSSSDVAREADWKCSESADFF